MLVARIERSQLRARLELELALLGGSAAERPPREGAALLVRSVREDARERQRRQEREDDELKRSSHGTEPFKPPDDEKGRCS